MRLKPSVRDLITVGCVIIGSLLCAININTFINAGGLFPGGFTGLTVFIQRCAEKYMNLQVPYSAVNFALNAIPAYIGYKTVGKKFTLYSCVMIVLTGVFVEILPVTNITEDILLITIFGIFRRVSERGAGKVCRLSSGDYRRRHAADSSAT